MEALSMPRIFKISGYLVYFWSNENSPLEPVHVHVSKGFPSEGTAKIWITRSGRCLLCNNNSHISQACELAEKLNVRNLLLYHTEDKNLAERNRLYLEEGSQYYHGNLFVQDDLDSISL